MQCTNEGTRRQDKAKGQDKYAPASRESSRTNLDGKWMSVIRKKPNIPASAKHIQYRGSMSNAGSTRGYSGSRRGRDYRRSSSHQALPEATVAVFQSQRTPSVGSGRRRRGFQPDEVNKNKERFGAGDPLTTQNGDNVEKLIAIDNWPSASTTTNNPASTMTSRSVQPLAPHLRLHVKDKKSNHQPLIRTQTVTMDASRPELDPVHFFCDVSEPTESETSSTQVITDRKPSCWSVVSPPEAPPTEWNSSAADIDRPGMTKLPIYRMPKAEREIADNSFNRQQAKLKSRATGSTSKAQKPYEMNGSPRSAALEKDEVQAAAYIASRKDGHAPDSLHHQLQQLQHDERLDAEQASQVKTIQEDVLAKTMQPSPGVPLESDELEAASPAQDKSQVRVLDAQKSSIASPTVATQAKINQVSTPPKKQSCVAFPHLKVQPTHSEPDNKNEILLPHLRRSVSPSVTTVTRSSALEEGLEPGKYTISAMQNNKLPPHLQGPSATRPRTNKGPLPVTSPSPTPQQKEHSYRPTIDMNEEVTATQPVLDMDEEIAAGLRAETSCPSPIAQPAYSNTQETNEQILYVPPHIRNSSSNLNSSAADSKSKATDKDTKSQADQHKDRNYSARARKNDAKAGRDAGALLEVNSRRKNANLASSSRNGAILDGAKSSVKKGKKPAREFESVDYTSELVDWDGKMNPPPVGDEWDHRRPFNPQSHERLSVVEAWREEHAADSEESNRVIVNTASPDFQTGEGLVAGYVNVLSPINKVEHETRTSNDDFTQARRHQSAAEAMKDYEAKLAAKPKTISSGIDGMTKEEKRALRRALIEEERTRVIPLNPHAPAANVYLRPAESKDMGQVMNIYNYHVRETSFVLHLDPVDDLYWRDRLQEAEDEKNPFVVAIHMGEKSCRNQGDIIRKKQENVVGFAVAANYGGKDTMFRSSVELELMVHQEFYHQGIGRTLLDRILAALSPDHNLLECAPFLPYNDICHWISGGSRQAKAIMVNILYSDDIEDTVTWRKQWLAKYEFQHVGTMRHIGFKKGKLVNMCQLVLNTSVRL